MKMVQYLITGLVTLKFFQKQKCFVHSLLLLSVPDTENTTGKSSYSCAEFLYTKLPFLCLQSVQEY